MIFGVVGLERDGVLGDFDSRFRGGMRLPFIAHLNGDLGHVGFSQSGLILRRRVIRRFLRRRRCLRRHAIERRAILRIARLVQIRAVDRGANPQHEYQCVHFSPYCIQTFGRPTIGTGRYNI
jgi:hypothetical protein